jgi:hypothetical protein
LVISRKIGLSPLITDSDRWLINTNLEQDWLTCNYPLEIFMWSYRIGEQCKLGDYDHQNFLK